MVLKQYLAGIKDLLASPEACLKVVRERVVVMVHPMYSQNLKKGITLELDAMLRRYSPELGGLPLAYEKPQLISTHGWLFHTNPFNHLLVEATFYIFAPQIGSIVEGMVKKKSPNHLGCLVHETFNISVPRPQENRANWAGLRTEEGDIVKLKLSEIRMGYYLPYIKGNIIPESVDEAVRARTHTNVTGIKTTFDDDSGISSNEADDSINAGQKKVKKFGESEEDEESNEGSELEEEESSEKEKASTSHTEVNSPSKTMKGERSIEKKTKKSKKEMKAMLPLLNIKEEPFSCDEGRSSPKKGNKRKRSNEDTPDAVQDKKRRKKEKKAQEWLDSPIINKTLANIKSEHNVSPRKDQKTKLSHLQSTPESNHETPTMSSKKSKKKKQEINRELALKIKQERTDDTPVTNIMQGLPSLPTPGDKDWSKVKIKSEPNWDGNTEKTKKKKKKNKLAMKDV